MIMASEDEALSKFRAELNELDSSLIELLGRRFAVVKAVGEHKKQHNIPMMQQGRVEQVKARCAALGEQHGLDPHFVRKLYALIIEEACRVEDVIIEAEG